MHTTKSKLNSSFALSCEIFSSLPTWNCFVCCTPKFSTTGMENKSCVKHTHRRGIGENVSHGERGHRFHSFVRDSSRHRLIGRPISDADSFSLFLSQKQIPTTESLYWITYFPFWPESFGLRGQSNSYSQMS